METMDTRAIQAAEWDRMMSVPIRDVSERQHTWLGELTGAQLAAVHEQRQVYERGGVSGDIDGLTLMALRLYDSDRDGPPDGLWVDFMYLQEREGVEPTRPGLETTIFGPDGRVLDSQDYG